MVGQCGGGLESSGPCLFQGGAWYQGAACEVVGGSLGLLVGCQLWWAAPAACEGFGVLCGVEPVSLAVIDDVFELVQQGETLPHFGIVMVEADDPLLAVPVAHARNRQLLADDTDAVQVGDVVFGDAGQLEAGLAGGQELVEFGGLAFGQVECFGETAGAVGCELAEAPQNA